MWQSLLSVLKDFWGVIPLSALIIVFIRHKLSFSNHKKFKKFDNRLEAVNKLWELTVDLERKVLAMNYIDPEAKSKEVRDEVYDYSSFVEKNKHILGSDVVDISEMIGIYLMNAATWIFLLSFQYNRGVGENLSTQFKETQESFIDKMNRRKNELDKIVKRLNQ